MTYWIFIPPIRPTVETIQLLAMESQREGFWPRLSRLKCNIGWTIVLSVPLFLTPAITNLDLALPQESNRLLQPTLPSSRTYFVAFKLLSWMLLPPARFPVVK